MLTATLKVKDDGASVVHNPDSPAPTADQNRLVWTYKVRGLTAEINSFQVGPIPPDVPVSQIRVDVPRWTGTRVGQYISWTGPGNVAEGQIATASFETSADAVQASGLLQALIFVDVLPARRGVRPSTVPTVIPAKPPA